MNTATPTPPELTQLEQAFAELRAFIETIPDGALDWQPEDGEWSIKETIAHVAHAYDFYILILEQARTQSFQTVTMHRDLPGWQNLFSTDDAVKACLTTADVMAALQQAHAHAVTIFKSITADELDSTFTYDSTRSDEPPYTTTLRHRVLERATHHIHEHQPQLQYTLSRWKIDNTIKKQAKNGDEANGEQ